MFIVSASKGPGAMSCHQRIFRPYKTVNQASIYPSFHAAKCYCMFSMGKPCAGPQVITVSLYPEAITDADSISTWALAYRQLFPPLPHF